MKHYFFISIMLLIFAGNAAAVSTNACVQLSESVHHMEEMEREAKGMMANSQDHNLHEKACSGCCDTEHASCTSGCAANCSVYLTSLHTFIVTEFKESPTSLILHKLFPDVYARLLRPPRHV